MSLLTSDLLVCDDDINFQPSGLSQTSCPNRSVASLIEATGTENYSDVLFKYLQETCGADYHAAFSIGPDAPDEIAARSHDGSQTAHERVGAYLQCSYWSKDPAMVYARTQLPGRKAILMRTDMALLEASEIKEVIWPKVCDRLVIAGWSKRLAYSVSIIREGSSHFSTAQIRQINYSAEILIASLAKHVEITNSRLPSQAIILNSLPEIQSCIGEYPLLTRREREVCARILYGMSTTGIALDLKISSETVKTFRKLAYRRLDIGSERELLQWYLELQSFRHLHT